MIGIDMRAALLPFLLFHSQFPVKRPKPGSFRPQARFAVIPADAGIQ